LISTSTNLTKLLRYFFIRREIPDPAARTRRLIAALATLCLLGAMAAGCGKPPSQPAPAAAATVALGPDEPYKTLPPDIYKEMPVYPGAAIEHVRRPKGAMREIVFSSGATMPALVAYFKDELKKNNFRVTSSLIMPARRTWSCDFHKEGRPGSIMLYPSDNDKSIMTIDLIYEMPSKVDPSLLEPQETFDVEGPGPVAQQAPNSQPNTKQN